MHLPVSHDSAATSESATMNLLMSSWRLLLRSLLIAASTTARHTSRHVVNTRVHKSMTYERKYKLQACSSKACSHAPPFTHRVGSLTGIPPLVCAPCATMHHVRSGMDVGRPVTTKTNMKNESVLSRWEGWGKQDRGLTQNGHDPLSTQPPPMYSPTLARIASLRYAKA